MRRSIALLLTLMVSPAAAQELAAPKLKWKFKTVYSFTGLADGGEPIGGLIRDREGNLYGTTSVGGSQGASCVPTDGCGVVFKIDRTGDLTTLYTFTGGADGYNTGTTGSLARDSAGNLYGVTSMGANPTCGGPLFGCGVVYKVDSAGVESVLYTFTGGADGGVPSGTLLRGSDGSLYGTALLGGDSNLGTVFKVDATGTETVLYSFPGGTDGARPDGGVIRDESGNFYGTTIEGGTYNAGTIFKLSPSGEEKVIYAFTKGSDGAYPGGLVHDPSGTLYGTASDGGCCGVVFKLAHAAMDPAWKLTVLYTFTGGADGGFAAGGIPAALVRDPAGNLYGTTGGGGNFNSTCNVGCGVVFRLDRRNQETVLYSFTGGTDGYAPVGQLLRTEDGKLYGTTAGGGSPSCILEFTTCGTVFELSPRRAGNN